MSSGGAGFSWSTACYTFEMAIVLFLVLLAVLFLVVGLIVTAIKWLTILALIFVLLALAQGYRARRH